MQRGYSKYKKWIQKKIIVNNNSNNIKNKELQNLKNMYNELNEKFKSFKNKNRNLNLDNKDNKQIEEIKGINIEKYAANSNNKEKKFKIYINNKKIFFDDITIKITNDEEEKNLADKFKVILKKSKVDDNIIYEISSICN